MVGKWRQCDTDYPSQTIWKDTEYEYDRAVFSVDHADKGELFEGLKIWEDGEYRKIQGTYPVISLSFANVKETTFQNTKEKICQLLTNIYVKYSFLKGAYPELRVCLYGEDGSD